MAVTITNDAGTTRTNLGLGDAATKTVGTASGNIPLVSSLKTVGGSSIIGSGDISTLPSGGTANQVLTSDASSNATWADAAAAGKVLQVVASNPHYGASWDAGNSYADIPSMSITITPSATSSRIYYTFLTRAHSNGSGGTNMYIRTLRNGTVIKNSNRWFGFQEGNGAWQAHAIFVTGVDSPNTTSPVQYDLQAQTDNGTFRIHDNTNGLNEITLIAMEIGV